MAKEGGLGLSEFVHFPAHSALSFLFATGFVFCLLIGRIRHVFND